MRTWVTTVVECVGAVLMSAGVTALVDGPWLAVAAVSAGVGAVAAGVIEGRR